MAVRFTNPTTQKQESSSQSATEPVVIAMGASTGGTESVLTVLKQFPENCPPILIVQHMPPVFTKMYADRLHSICKMNVKEAQNGDVVQSGWVYLAPGDFQMRLVSEQDRLMLSVHGGDKVSGHKPSVDVLFSSVAKIMKRKAIGVIMTGMGRDGAEGLLEMRKAGAFTIGEDASTCVVYGMPMEAKKIGAVVKEVPLHFISHTIQQNLQKYKI